MLERLYKLHNFKGSVAFVGDIHFRESNPRARVGSYFESTLNDFKRILDRHDIVVILGDVFDSPTLPMRSLSILLNTLHDYVWEKGKRIYTIIGNHDIYNENIEKTLEKTVLNLFDKLGYIKIFDKLYIGSLFINGLHYRSKVNDISELPIETGLTNILTAHAFYEFDLDASCSFSREQLENLGYDYVILGHDHRPYRLSKFDNFTLVRCGSLCRLSSHDYNLSRDEIAYFTIEIDENNTYNVCERTIEVDKAEDVYNSECFRKPIENNNALVENLDELISFFQIKKKGVYTIASALKDLGALPYVVDYIKDVHMDLEMTFG